MMKLKMKCMKLKNGVRKLNKNIWNNEINRYEYDFSNLKQ